MTISLNTKETEALREFERLVFKWNKAINLVSNTDALWKRHILDSAQLINIVPRGFEVLDVGSGGGFPSIVLSILGYRVTMVESDVRKCQFLSEAIRHLNLDATVVNDRIEKFSHEKFDFITARAFSDVDTILNLTSHLRDESTTYVLFKTEMANKELDKAMENWVFHMEHSKSVTEKSHLIYKISGVKIVKASRSIE